MILIFSSRGEFVTDETGTGFVYIAPSHGRDDYDLASKNGIETPFMIDDEGVYLPSVKIFAGKKVYDDGSYGDGNGAVIKELINCNALFAKNKLIINILIVGDLKRLYYSNTLSGLFLGKK